MLDKKGIEIKLGDIISNKFTKYKVIEYKNKLHADDGSHMFPIDSENERVSIKYEVIS